MKMKGRGWVGLCVLMLALFACQTQQKPAEQPAAEKVEKTAEIVAPARPEIPGITPDVVYVAPGIDKTWPGLVSLAEQIQKDVNALQGLFAKGDIKGIVGMLHARYAVVSGINYALLYGKDSSPFWSGFHAEGAALEIKVVSVYISNAPGPHLRLPPPKEAEIKALPGKKSYDAVAFVVVEIRFTSKAGIGIVHYLNWEYCHQWCCVWGPESECPPPIEGAIAR
jgi:hypothetical protein